LGAIFQGDELLIILVILLLILGPTKLPALAKGLGKAIREFKKASSGFYDEESTEQSPKTPTAPSPANPPRGLAPIATAGQAEAQAATAQVQVDDQLIKRLAERLGISAEGKSSEELRAEVIEKAKEKGLF
jgi:sec-independent protein translocase protein TatA